MASDLPNCLDTVVANLSTAAFSAWCADGLKRQVHAALQVNETFTPQDQADVKRWCADAGYEVIFSKTCSTAGDHARIAALRSIICELWARCFNIEQPGVSTLVVGASACELKRWCTHGHVSYWLPMCEAKDSARSYLAMARDAMSSRRARASKQQTKLARMAAAPHCRLRLRPLANSCPITRRPRRLPICLRRCTLPQPCMSLTPRPRSWLCSIVRTIKACSTGLTSSPGPRRASPAAFPCSRLSFSFPGFPTCNW